ncbi:copper chaperone CopZ [Macrococcus epidermidis]|uniref:copper chaperone CopZ n=1 Tax=Macrococcus epidermidis TaxID=1902580 RepID=UPI001EF22CDE|nr:copper chaperone CopZ [Macrococcus epidermidis]MCG7418921.1 copper chaperone CopZ [Macrococcus epidermidis]
METILKVEGMTCLHCKEAVEGAVNKLDGVKSAAVDLEAANVTVDHEESVTVETMKEAIEDQGYDVVK